MDDELIDANGRPLSRRSRLPGTGFFYPDSLDEDRADERAREAIDGTEAVVIADADADGLACAALIRETYGAALDVADFEASITERLDEPVRAVEGDNGDSDRELERGANSDGCGDENACGNEDDHTASSVALIGAGPGSLDRALERTASYVEPGADLYVCDLCPDEYDAVAEQLATLTRRCGTVAWFDHHQWESAVMRAVRGAGVDLTVGDSDVECSADVTLRALNYEFPDRFADLAAVTRDHDLWLKEDPRSDDLADYAYWAPPEEYVAVVGAHGPDLPPAVEAYLDQRRAEKEALIERAVGRATTHEVGPWTVGVTYGRCSQNEVAERLREDGADAAVIVKPAGSASIRGSDGEGDRTGFALAHEVAGRVNGGGHPQAAGCKPDIYDDMLDYAHHWTTDGAAAKRVILAAFEAVAAEHADDD